MTIRMMSGYCYEFSGAGLPDESPDDDWDTEIYEPTGDEEKVGTRDIDGIGCVVFLCPDGMFRAQTTSAVTDGS